MKPCLNRVMTAVFIVLTIFFVSSLKNTAYGEEPQKKQLTEPIIKSINHNKCNAFTFDGTASYDPDNQKLDFSWDLGDGTTSTESIIDHTYEKAGEYNVSLTVTDNSELECSSSTSKKLIRVNIPPVAAFNSPDLICTDEEVTFDASASYDKSGDPLYYKWEFADGMQKEGMTVKRSFNKGGEYLVKLTVDDRTGTICSSEMVNKIIKVNEPPKAKAGRDVVMECLDSDAPLTVTFDAANTKDANNDNLIYFWDFGDGTTGEGILVTHTYPSQGHYEVTLTVSDNSGLSCNTSTDNIFVNLEYAPKADAGEDTSVCFGDEVTFDGSNSLISKENAQFSFWNFGDGDHQMGAHATHTYKKAGTYIATITVENAHIPYRIPGTYHKTQMKKELGGHDIKTHCPKSVDTRKVIVNSAPSVNLKVAKPKGCLGDEFHFNASAASDKDLFDKLEYYWNFGDGTITKGNAHASHTYEKGGNYMVTVIVDDTKGSDCSSASATASIKVNTPPVANAGENVACCSGTETRFDGSASTDPDGDALTYIWNFDDGATDQGVVVNHMYQQHGLFDVKLVVDDNSGTECSSASAGFSANVNAGPVSVIQVR